MVLMELIKDIIPPGVVNVVTGQDKTGAALASNTRIGKIAFTGSTDTGSSVLHSFVDNLIAAMIELGEKR